ncbi:hypothetical protein [Alkaliphilus transvaalensis]|uniref:hypothetical protein n=1 Tax=Alkaliphilus transvaalensis TaxID=114628 RepID=UPI00047B2453|nr:hypothetical protein [Alkaliphilus transvaalensis]
MKTNFRIVLSIIVCCILVYGIVNLYQTNQKLQDLIMLQNRNELIKIQKLATNSNFEIQQHIENKELSSNDLEKLIAQLIEIRDSLSTISNNIDNTYSKRYIEKNLTTRNMLSYHEVMGFYNNYSMNKLTTELDVNDINGLKRVAKVYNEYIDIANGAVYKIDTNKEWVSEFSKFFSLVTFMLE